MLQSTTSSAGCLNQWLFLLSTKSAPFICTWLHRQLVWLAFISWLIIRILWGNFVWCECVKANNKNHLRFRTWSDNIIYSSIYKVGSCLCVVNSMVRLSYLPLLLHFNNINLTIRHINKCLAWFLEWILELNSEVVGVVYW